MNPDRDISKLDKTFQKKVKQFLSLTKHLGVFITEAYRTQERQNYLYEQGRTRPGPIITRTKNSMHTKGLAIDIAFNGAELYPQSFDRWRAVANIAKDCGINWGYDLWGWDMVHFEDNLQPINQEDIKARKLVQDRIDYFMKAYLVSDTDMDLPITKRNTLTILSSVNLELAKEIARLRERIDKLEGYQ